MENRSLLLNHKWASRLCVNEWKKGGTELKEGFKISGRREEEQRGKKNCDGGRWRKQLIPQQVDVRNVPGAVSDAGLTGTAIELCDGFRRTSKNLRNPPSLHCLFKSASDREKKNPKRHIWKP